MKEFSENAPESWTETQLFEYLQSMYIISLDDTIDDWKNKRSKMVDMVRDDIENEY